MPLLTRPSTRSVATVRRLAIATGGLCQGLSGAATPARLALGRAGVGTVMVVQPRLMPTLMGVDSASATKTSWVVQMLGAREIALGLGTLVALRSPDSRVARTWVAAGVLSDGVDVLAVGGAVLRGRLSRGSGALVVATALGAALAGLRALKVPADRL